MQGEQPTTIVIVGASGDLTKKKLIPALFSLYCNGFLPDQFSVIGFARSQKTDDEFRNDISENLTSRFEPEPEVCDIRIGGFLKRAHYYSGGYGDPEAFRELARRFPEIDDDGHNLLVYLAIPPTVFSTTVHSLGESGVARQKTGAWSRVVVEKPFGRDSESSQELTRTLASIYPEEQTYRIDHYLGKEVIQNLLILRFANLIFEPIWNRNYIDRVQITFSEDIGVEGRAGYFDSIGIIRDVIQNHLLQMVALTAMEPPNTLNAYEIAQEKAKVLRAIEPLKGEDVVTGQYEGYLEDPEVPAGSTTETFARATFQVRNARWSGVPFEIVAGKALSGRKTEIEISFRYLPYSIFRDAGFSNNTLRIRVQPNEAIELLVNNKRPGLGLEISQVSLNMLYHREFREKLPEAYERLIFDVLRGERALFIQHEELAAAWDIVTPVLKRIGSGEVPPMSYPRGSDGPSFADGERLGAQLNA
ncbi:MAG: glucose-6-phosphate dehydrogenase [Spirochaetaceae bacterium]